MSFNVEKIRNVLILAPDKHMGDLVLSLSTISALKDFFKGKNFYLVVDSAYAEIVAAIDGIENLILYPRKLFNRNHFMKQLTILFNFLRQLRNTLPDIAIDLQGGVASSTMTFLSGAPLRMGRSTAKRPYFYNLKINPVHGRHKFHSYTQIAYAAGVQSKINVSSIRASASNRSALKSILLKEGITIEKPVICIHPGAGVEYKQWTEEGFADISSWLVSEGFQVVFVGSSNESGKIGGITSIMKNHAYNLAGELSLGELTALFEISSLYIGNDSGPMHLAAAVNTPVVALFGPAGENRWGPLSEKAIVLRGEEPCEKCKGKDCQYNFKCIRTISSDDIKIAIESLIGFSNKDKDI
jgi:heptosyltransferase-3